MRQPFSKLVRSLALAGVLFVAGLGATRLAQPGPQAVAASEFFVLDQWAEQVLGLALPERALTMRGPTGDVDLGTRALSARFLPSGEILFIDDDLALKRLNPATGGLVELLPSGSANAPLFINPDGGSVAYLKPRDLASREEVLFPMSNGIAVLDLQTRVERVLLEVPDVTVNLYGWSGDRLLVQIPTWDPVTLALPDVMQIAALPVSGAHSLPSPVAELPPLDPAARYPQTSLDQRFLAYETPGGVVVATLASGGAAYAVYDDLRDPLWTEDGLTVAQASTRKTLEWSVKDVSKAAPALGALAWPPHALASEVPAASAEANAILFYRPVTASTRVSAYMDLDINGQSIRDWKGYVGCCWQYGRAYDGHWGTDYDGVTGHPIYAPALGVVNRVIIYCCNTYPNGPATFGTSVRLYHGQLSDGLHYWTLVGHLLPEGVGVSEGQSVNSLPTQLALMGNTGWSTGDHTHLQVYRKQDNNINGAFSIDPYEHGLISDTPIAVAPPTPTLPPATTGHVSGVVRDAQNQPVAGATVKLQLAGQVFVTTSDPGGVYAFTEMPPGSATLRAVKGARWGTAAGSVQVAQVMGGDIALSQCAGQPVAADGCPALLHDNAAFVTDVTYDDGTVVAAGQVLQKTWRLHNLGTTTWGAGYQLVFVSGNKEVNTPSAVNVPGTAVNATVDVSVSMTAAGATGTHRGYWRLRSPQGVYFGPTIWVELNSQPGGKVTAHTIVTEAWDDTPEKSGQAAAPSSPNAAGCVVTAPATSSANTFAVSWAASGGATIVSYDVQFLDSSRGGWRDWVRGYPAGQTSAPFTGQVGHSYGFRCRATDQAPSTGAYPANADATTLVGQMAGQPDLRLTNLQVRPAPGGGLLATVLVENAGVAGTQRGFFVDLYRNDPPGGLHDYGGIVNTWASEPIAAGASVTLNFALTEPAGNADLTAQVDTGNLVPESNENNNLYTTAASGCVMIEDAFEYDDVPGAAKPLALGASQARNLGGPSEKDWVTLSVTPGRLYRLETLSLGTGVDTRLTVYNAAGTQSLASNDDLGGASLASRLLFAPRGAATTYLVLVESWNPASGGCGATYSLQATDIGMAHVRFLPVLLMK